MKTIKNAHPLVNNSVKKIFLFIFFACHALMAQDNIVFERIGLKVERENMAPLLNTLDHFYSSIDIPEGVFIRLNSVAFKSEELEATHYLTLVGSVNGLAKLKELRSGSAYELYLSELYKVASKVSVTLGRTLIRMGLDKRKGHKGIQLWKWKVDNAAVFTDAFLKLMKVYKHPGYAALGQFSHGISSNGETHYIYVSHKDYKASLVNNIDTDQEKRALQTFLSTVKPIATPLGSSTVYNVKEWK